MDLPSIRSFGYHISNCKVCRSLNSKDAFFQSSHVYTRGKEPTEGSPHQLNGSGQRWLLSESQPIVFPGLSYGGARETRETY
jgi:hypothetical protein